MAVEPLFSSQIYIDNLDVTGVSNDVGVDASCAELDKTTFASGGWFEFAAGLKAGTVKHDGWFDADLTTSLPDADMWAGVGVTGRPVTVTGKTAAAADRVYLGELMAGRYQFLGSVGELTPAAGEMVVSSGRAGIARGFMLWPKATVTATSGTAVQIGAVPAGSRLVVALHVFTAGTSVTFNLQRDDAVGFSTPVTHLTRTIDNVNDSELIIDTTITTDSWWRVNWASLTGTFVAAVAAAVVT